MGERRGKDGQDGDDPDDGGVMLGYPPSSRAKRGTWFVYGRAIHGQVSRVRSG